MMRQRQRPLPAAPVQGTRNQYRFQTLVVSLIIAVTVAACGGSSTDTTTQSDASIASAANADSDQATDVTQSSTNESEAVALPPGFTLPDGWSVDDGPFEDFASLPQPGSIVFYNGSTFYRDASPTEPIVQQWALLEDAATVARFYLTELPKNGFELTTGFNNAIVDVSEVDDDALQYQLIYVYPDGRRGDMVITPDNRLGTTAVAANTRPPSS